MEKRYPRVELINLDGAPPEVWEATWVIAIGRRGYSEEEVQAAIELIERKYGQKS